MSGNTFDFTMLPDQLLGHVDNGAVDPLGRLAQVENDRFEIKRVHKTSYKHGINSHLFARKRILQDNESFCTHHPLEMSPYTACALFPGDSLPPLLGNNTVC
jgi:hypothetical protein